MLVKRSRQWCGLDQLWRTRLGDVGKIVEEAIFVKDQAIDGGSKPLLWSAGRFGEGSADRVLAMFPFSQVE
jgi:hypothetical protein